MEKKLPAGRRRIWLWICIPLLVIIALFIFTISGVNTFLKPSIREALVKVIVNGSDSLYIVSIDDYAVGPGGNSAVVRGVNIQVDSLRYQALEKKGRLPRLVFSLQVREARISGINPLQLWKQKNIVCDEITLDSVNLNLLQQTKPPDSLKNKDTKTLYELIKPDINTIRIRAIRITRADVLYRTVQEQTNKKSWWHFRNTTALLDDILVDSTSSLDTSRVWYAGNLHATLGSLKMNSNDGVYSLATSNTEYDHHERIAIIRNFKMLPVLTRAQFTKQTGYAKDLFTVKLSSVHISEFNPGPLLLDGNLQAGVLELQSEDIEIYKDNTAPPDTRSKMGKYPHQLLAKAPLEIDIRRINISNGKLVVMQRSRKTGEVGSFIFTNINGSIHNVTNVSTRIRQNAWCKADLRANFMGPNLMHAVFHFDLASSSGHFKTEAFLSSLKPDNINSSFRALARAELQSFTLNEMAYSVEGYDGYAIGNMRLLYQDLKLSVLEEKDDGKLRKKGLISLLANTLKIYDINPMPGKEERRAIAIREPRIREKNFFGLVVHTMLTCVQQVVIKGKNKELPGLSKKK